MKMNKIMVISVVITSLMMADTNAAWSRIGQFARKVLVSGTGVTAALAAAEVAVDDLKKTEDLKKECDAIQSFIGPELKVELDAFCKERGVEEVIYVPGSQFLSPFAFPWKGKKYIGLSFMDQNMLFATQGAVMQTPRGLTVFTRAHLLAVLEHELDHLRNDDFLIERSVCKSAVLPAALVAAKAARVTGKSRLASLGAFVGVGISGIGLYSALSRFHEKRADLAISSSESALGVIHYLEAIEDFYGAQLDEMKTKRGKLHPLVKLAELEKDISIEHPPFQERKVYLEKHALQLKAQEDAVGVKTNFRKSVESFERCIDRLVAQQQETRTEEQKKLENNQ